MFFALAVAEPTPFPALPPCTQVIVEMVDPVNSAKAKAGDFFRIKTTGAVTRGGKIALPEGMPGYGIVTLAVAAGKGHGGALGLEPLYLYFPNGVKVHVVRDRRPNELTAQGASGGIPGYVGAVPLPGVGLAISAFNALHKGKDITIPPGTLASVFASDSPETAKCQTEE